jgi:hypothetical protein
VRSTLGRRFVVSLVAFVVMAGATRAQSAPSQFIPFQEFLAGVTSADAASYLNTPGARVESAAAFEEMRGHLLSLYTGVNPTNSFLLGSQYIDCIPVMQQPSVRLLGVTGIAAQPPPPPPLPGPPPPGVVTSSPLDPFGNQVACRSGTIPMQRLTLEDLAHFATVRDFLHKEPPPLAASPPAISNNDYRYATAFSQASNLGAGTLLQVWYPTVPTGSYGHSLSQMWIASSLLVTPALQTAEAGWIVYPIFFNTTAAVLFIYWTADDYTNTGCYNLSCAGFVQTSNVAVLGAPNWPGPSVIGNYQAAVFYGVGWQFYQGNWWLYLFNTVVNGKLDPYIGYYPGSIYKGGQLSQYSQGLEFGGEVANVYPGSSPWPQMGSGEFANGAFAASQGGPIQFFDLSGKAQVLHFGLFWNPPCYTVQSDLGYDYFYFGGPGGNGC